ncbi:histidinol-phosphate aminotransferase family protein [bacterium]|nr:histidinol-phosphate aminotransferase family protein [bacterium]
MKRSQLDKDRGFVPDLGALLRDAAGATMLVLVNPNNPTGAFVPSEFIEAVLSMLDPRTLLLVDETYVDYVSPSPSVERKVAGRDNLLVLKSMSKYYALSGARVAYLAAPSRIIGRLSTISPPWAVGLPSQVAAVAALGDESYYRERVRQTRQLRERLAADLRGLLGLRVYHSVANFILMELLDPSLSAEVVYCEMKRRGVHVRNCDSQSVQFNGRFLRTAVKDAVGNRVIAAALREVLETREVAAATG